MGWQASIASICPLFLVLCLFIFLFALVGMQFYGITLPTETSP